MKKNIISLTFIAAILISSNVAIACDIYFTITNKFRAKMTMDISGPCMRQSDTHTIDTGESFTYHAEGSICSCHGKYTFDGRYTMNPTWEVWGDTYNVSFEKDGHYYATIAGGNEASLTWD